MNLTKKSPLVAFFLTLFLGPLGLLYSSIVGAIILGAIAFFTLATIVGPLICWVLSILVGLYCVYDHNENVDKTIHLMQNK